MRVKLPLRAPARACVPYIVHKERSSTIYGLFFQRRGLQSGNCLIPKRPVSCCQLVGCQRTVELILIEHVHILGHMEIDNAITSFAALSQATRLGAFRLLVRHEPAGLPAGEIARQLSVPHNTMSAHLAVLTRAGWINSRRQSRSIIYRANLDHVKEIIQFLVRDCCAGHPELCEPLMASLSVLPPGEGK